MTVMCLIGVDRERCVESVLDICSLEEAERLVNRTALDLFFDRLV